MPVGFTGRGENPPPSVVLVLDAYSEARTSSRFLGYHAVPHVVPSGFFSVLTDIILPTLFDTEVIISLMLFLETEAQKG